MNSKLHNFDAGPPATAHEARDWLINGKAWCIAQKPSIVARYECVSDYAFPFDSVERSQADEKSARKLTKQAISTLEEAHFAARQGQLFDVGPGSIEPYLSVSIFEAFANGTLGFPYAVTPIFYKTDDGTRLLSVVYDDHRVRTFEVGEAHENGEVWVCWAPIIFDHGEGELFGWTSSLHLLWAIADVRFPVQRVALSSPSYWRLDANAIMELYEATRGRKWTLQEIEKYATRDRIYYATARAN
jgi:hypothetical protein